MAEFSSPTGRLLDFRWQTLASQRPFQHHWRMRRSASWLNAGQSPEVAVPCLHQANQAGCLAKLAVAWLRTPRTARLLQSSLLRDGCVIAALLANLSINGRDQKPFHQCKACNSVSVRVRSHIRSHIRSPGSFR